jgi:Glycoside hydrolase family 5 C-terminal domain
LVPKAGSQESFYFPDGTLQTGKVRRLVRTYAQAIQGVPTSMSFDPATKDFVLVFEADPAIKAPTVIFASEDFWYTGGFSVSTEPASCAVTRPKRNFVEVLAKEPGTVTVRVKATGH